MFLDSAQQDDQESDTLQRTSSYEELVKQQAAITRQLAAKPVESV